LNFNFEQRSPAFFPSLAKRRDRALRTILRSAPPGFARIAIDARCPRWLGLAPHRLFLELLRRGIWAIPFNEDDLSGHEIPSAHSPSESLTDAVVYQLCVAHGIQPDELDHLINSSASVAADFDAALRIALHREAAFDRFATQLGIGGVAYMHGYTPTAAVMRSVARRRGIRLLGLENTLFKDRFTWDSSSGIACFTDRSRAAFRLSVKQSADPERWRSEGNLRSIKSAEHISGTGAVPIRGAYILFLGQVFTDASIIFGCSPGWGPLQVAEFLYREAHADAMGLVVKCHPKESTGCDPVFNNPYAGLFARRLAKTLPENAQPNGLLVDSTNDLDTYAAIRSATCVVTMNSQAGIEAAAMGIPTIVCARAHYTNCGFTHDGSTPEALRHSLLICASLSRREREVSREKAMNFAAVLREHVFVPRTAASVASVIGRELWTTARSPGRAALRGGRAGDDS